MQYTSTDTTNGFEPWTEENEVSAYASPNRRIAKIPTGPKPQNRAPDIPNCNADVRRGPMVVNLPSPGGRILAQSSMELSPENFFMS